MMQLTKLGLSRLTWVNECLASCLASSRGVPEPLAEVMRYSLLAGGKRLRPLLAVSGAEALGATQEQVEELAVALECLHTYSLIHDDLPSMDDDDLRRGKPTAHKVFGEDMAILAGDALQTRAFELLSSQPFRHRVGDTCALQVIARVSRAVGAGGMVGGQVLDISAAEDIDLPTLKSLHTLKTGALIRTSVVCGGLVGGATDEDLAHLTTYGEALGLAFQIVDDILDVTSTTELLGKPQGSDSKNGKATYVDLLGLQEAKATAERLTEKALAIAASYGASGSLLKELALLTLQRQH